MKCSICQGEIVGRGCNADPVNEGQCCDRCDSFVVLPARLVAIGYSRLLAEETAKMIWEMRDEKA